MIEFGASSKTIILWFLLTCSKLLWVTLTKFCKVSSNCDGFLWKGACWLCCIPWLVFEFWLLFQQKFGWSFQPKLYVLEYWLFFWKTANWTSSLVPSNGHLPFACSPPYKSHLSVYTWLMLALPKLPSTSFLFNNSIWTKRAVYVSRGTFRRAHSF